jgi:hypothetical protein
MPLPQAANPFQTRIRDVGARGRRSFAQDSPGQLLQGLVFDLPDAFAG